MLVFLIKIAYTNETFDSKRFQSIKGDFSDGENEQIFGCWVGFPSIPRVSHKGLGEGGNSPHLVGATIFIWHMILGT